jgi:transposase
MVSPYDKANQPEPESVDLAALILDERLQSRAGVDPDTVAEYEDALRRGAEFEALWAVEIDGGLYLVDGWQRYEAAERVGIVEFPVRVWFGTWEEAVELAAQCNARHGRPRTRADLAKTIAMLRTLPQWREASAVAIAKHVGVSHATISRVLAKLEEPDASFSGEKDADKPLIQNEATPDEAVNRREPEPKRITVKRGDQEYSMTPPRPAERRAEAETQSEPEAEPLSRQEQSRAVAKDNAERYYERIDKYPRRALNNLKKDYASLPAAEQAEFIASLGKMSVDHILARCEDLYESQLVTIATSVLRRIRSKEYDPQLATICIEVFNKIRSDKEKLKVDEVVARWSNEHTESDALEEETDTVGPA